MNTIEEAVHALRQGQCIVLLDHEDRENEGDLVAAAEHMTPELTNFFIKEGRGILCAPVGAVQARTLGLQPMVDRNEEMYLTAFTISIDHKDSSTGVSAQERSRTLQALADPSATPQTFIRPGHIFPLVAKPMGVLQRPGHTEASLDFMRLAGLRPAAAIIEVMNEDGTMKRLPDLRVFAQKHGLCMTTIDALVNYLQTHPEKAPSPLLRTHVWQDAEANLPSQFGHFSIHVFKNDLDRSEIVVLSKGDISNGEPVLTRLHSECFTGDIMASLRCDCQSQLHMALQRIEQEGRGTLLYLPQEGRGIGLSNKVRAYALQDQGFDTVEANLQLGLPIEMRDFTHAAEVLRALGVHQIRLMTNNPFKVEQMQKLGINVVTREAIISPPNTYNAHYIETKKNKMHHLFDEMP